MVLGKRVLLNETPPNESRDSGWAQNVDNVKENFEDFPPFPTLVEILPRKKNLGLTDTDTFRTAYFLMRAQEVCKSRSLFVGQGGFLGLGSACCRAGDEVWIVKGGRAPLVLRPVSEGEYTSMGEAYIHGAMSLNFLRTGLHGDIINVI